MGGKGSPVFIYHYVVVDSSKALQIVKEGLAARLWEISTELSKNADSLGILCTVDVCTCRQYAVNNYIYWE